MKNISKFSPLVALAFAGASLVGAAPALAQAVVAYDSMPSPTPPNVPSQPFQAQQTAEFGDEVTLQVGTSRQAGYATVLMSDWALHSDYPTLPSAGYTHPITLNIYANAADAQAHAPIKTVTQDFTIPWRPAADPTCAGGTAWRASNGNCYNGFAFPIVFDLRALNYALPDQFIYGIAYNTNTWGYSPIGLPGPYESLNVGLNTSASPVTVGTDVNPDAVYWNTETAAWYSDGGAGGVGVFRLDTNWTGYVPAVQFITFAFPATADSCKKGGWQDLVRSDFTSFKNQGDCVSYVQTGK